jgi:hypothetical protein
MTPPQIPDLGQLGGPQVVQITPWVIELQGTIRVRREDTARVIEIIHPSGVLAARIQLDAIAAAQIARELSGPAPAEANGAAPA